MSISENKIKQKIIKHTLKNGKKQTSEKNFKQSLKNLQKTQKKFYNEIFKQSTLNSTPTFRVIKLKKRKSKLEIPAFLSSYHYRSSWGLKNIIQASQTNKSFNKQLEQEILSNAKTTSSIIKSKEELHKNILKKKKYFKFYRW